MQQGTFDHQIAIVGAGFSGMAAAVAQDRRGLSDFLLLEKAADIGGTWRDNRYPGAACDVPSSLYSFSFEPWAGWSRRFAPAAEIHAYQRHVMQARNLAGRTRAGFEVASATWRDGGWTLRGTDGADLRVRFLISAAGALHLPFVPDLPGLRDFAGKVMHSAEWDHAYDWAGRRVIVIGSAASAVQIVPRLAETARRVTVMQRTPNWFLPRRDRKISGFERRMFRALPFAQRLYRWRQYLVNDVLFRANFDRRDSLRKRYVHRLVKRHLARSVPDPGLRSLLTPDYAIGCKRVLLSDDYLPALRRDNVDLVTAAVDRFTPTGLVTRDGRTIEADLVVMATGFRSTRLTGEMRVVGPGGLDLDEAWGGGIRAHRSVALDGFPNLFMMYGPNSNLGHSSILIMLEAQADHLARVLRHAADTGATRIDVRPEAEAEWNREMQRGLARTVWATGCRSWYQDADGRIFSLWPYSTTRFIREMRRAPLDEYRFSGPGARQAGPLSPRR